LKQPLPIAYSCGVEEELKKLWTELTMVDPWWAP